MSLNAIDQIIAREVGQLFWHLLPDIYPGLQYNEEDLRFRGIWGDPESDELRKIRKKDPPVDYPVIYLGSEFAFGFAPAPFLFPPKFGDPLRLSQYVSVLRRFLILQVTGSEQGHIPLIWRAVRTVASQSTTDETLRFVDQLWRGRWIIGSSGWSRMRRAVITGGSDDAVRALEDDTQQITAEVLRLVQTERQLKETSTSMDEWLHEAYCLLPDIETWFFSLRWGNERHKNEELEKYDRILDEFLADICTTIQIPCNACVGSNTLSDEYAIRPLLESDSIEEAVRRIRGTYRGRSIIPKVWFKAAENMITQLPRDIIQHRDSYPQFNPGEWAREHIPQKLRDGLDHVDLAACFGRAFTMDDRDGRWMLLLGLFGYTEPDDADSEDSKDR